MPESAGILALVERGYLRLADMPPLLGVTKQRCQQLAQREGFPKPGQDCRGATAVETQGRLAVAGRKASGLGA